MNDVSTSERLQGPHAPLMKGNSFRMITCEGHCFKEFIALEDLVLKSGDEDPFCVPRYDGCERTTVNVHLPQNGEGGKGHLLRVRVTQLVQPILKIHDIKYWIFLQLPQKFQVSMTVRPPQVPPQWLPQSSW